MSKELEIVEKLLSFAFAMSENMIGLTKGNYDENTFIKKTYDYLQKYTVDRNEQKTIKQSIERLEAIDNAEFGEALECLEKLRGMEISSMPFSDEYGTQEVDLNDIRKSGSQLNTDFREYINTIQQALQKVQEPKKYLKWEDLKFTEELKSLNVRMNNNDYILHYALDIFGGKCCFLYDSAISHHIDLTRQFFNDLHLEVVE